MRKILLAVALGSAALAFGSVEASAYDYPYCLTGRGVGSPGDCAYTSYAQCMASASGRGYSCSVNPRFAFARGGYPAAGYDGAPPSYSGPGYFGDDGYAPAPRRRYRREYVPY